MRGINQCEDGHLLQRSFMSAIFEANLGPGRHLAKCPVDGRRGVITRVSRSHLTEAQIAQITGRRKT